MVSILANHRRRLRCCLSDKTWQAFLIDDWHLLNLRGMVLGKGVFMKWVLIVLHYGFWCSCLSDTKEVATFDTKTACEDGVKRLPKAPGTIAYLCAEKEKP